MLIVRRYNLCNQHFYYGYLKFSGGTLQQRLSASPLTTDHPKLGEPLLHLDEPTLFLLMTLNFNNIYLYLLISGIFSNSEILGKIVSKNETDLSSVSKKNPTALDTFRRFRTEKPSKIKDFSYSVYSLELENLSNVIGLRKKQDTPKVVYFTLETSRPGRSLQEHLEPINSPHSYP